jgi:hypothetical protein
MTNGRARWFRCAATVVATAALVLANPGRAERDRPYQPLRELRGISAIRVEVDGMPNALEGTSISEKTLAVDVKESLVSLGVPLAKELDLQAPRLHIIALAHRIEGAYSFTIVVQLEERCSVARNPDLTIPWCVTWSAYPSIGSMAIAQAADIKDKVVQSANRFGTAWTADNR